MVEGPFRAVPGRAQQGRAARQAAGDVTEHPTTTSSSPRRRPAPTTPGSPFHPASPPRSGTGRSQRPVRGGDPDDPFTGLVFCRPDGRPLGPHLVLDRLHQLSEEAGVPRITVHDLRHLAATITITAGVPLTVVSKTLRHSTLSTTANIYSHLTRQAAREAVDTIDGTLTGAEKAGLGTSRPAWLRPPRDHIRRLGEVVRRLRSPAASASCATASRPQTGRASTLRPPRPRTYQRPPSHG
ncbi:tyrosine-type recombinase/integrase [Streptomyces cirratus]|uniref:tyrosine-type recombinase/integrase n=1 Tax=Streptomyces cirratus TaxID=68187 RepID=UPI00167D2DE1|nr:tyrosine-type recombinase/integrase [Streptomyces cirratus]